MGGTECMSKGGGEVMRGKGRKQIGQMQVHSVPPFSYHRLCFRVSINNYSTKIIQLQENGQTKSTVLLNHRSKRDVRRWIALVLYQLLKDGNNWMPHWHTDAKI